MYQRLEENSNMMSEHLALELLGIPKYRIHICDMAYIKERFEESCIAVRDNHRIADEDKPWRIEQYLDAYNVLTDIYNQRWKNNSKVTNIAKKTGYRLLDILSRLFSSSWTREYLDDEDATGSSLVSVGDEYIVHTSTLTEWDIVYDTIWLGYMTKHKEAYFQRLVIPREFHEYLSREHVENILEKTWLKTAHIIQHLKQLKILLTWKSTEIDIFQKRSQRREEGQITPNTFEAINEILIQPVFSSLRTLSTQLYSRDTSPGHTTTWSVNRTVWNTNYLHESIEYGTTSSQWSFHKVNAVRKFLVQIDDLHYELYTSIVAAAHSESISGIQAMIATRCEQLGEQKMDIDAIQQLVTYIIDRIDMLIKTMLSCQKQLGTILKQ